MVAKSLPPESRRAVPRALAELREVGGLTGTDIANIAEVSKATVSRWGSGAATESSRGSGFQQRIATRPS